jgi:signal transduction histidine kinase
MLASSKELEREQVKYEVHSNEELKIKTIPGFISEIILNLVINALEHGFKGSHQPGKLISITLSREVNDIRVEVFNNGHYIPENIIPRIFDQYFTTKPQVKNIISGIGLDHVKKLVEQGLEGTINCECEKGKGVKFIILFPIHE